ncbi:hypothetical protein Ddye_031397 [Dipteronia dyeriana]|uniref:Cation/H+ exchanger domain-containing protein n=1 Tax=Dipteronia dyeriana TaxID=168575 RepID=A0AAD9TI83_9ROSI|nr:hypothetical protein Ddye_031397 [Dipteronia dyeriana]
MSFLTKTHSPDYFSNLTTAKYRVCEEFSRIVFNSKGIWLEDYLNSAIPLFMLQLILSFFLSRLIYYVLRPLKQPKFVCNVLTGIILGTSVMGRNEKMMNLVFQPKNMMVNNTISSMSGLYFIFINSLKMDKSRLLQTVKSSWHVGLITFVVPWAFSIYVFYQVQGNIPGIVGGSFPAYLLALSARSYIAVIANALGELDLLSSELGQIAISSATVHELIGWLLTCVALLMQGPNQGSNGQKEGILTVLSLFAFILFLLFVIRPLILRVIRKNSDGKPVNGNYISALLAPLITGALSDVLGQTFFPGALLMGLIIPAGPPLGSVLVEKCELILSEILLPFLYIRTGQLTNVYSITNHEAFGYFHMTLATGYAGKVAGSLLCMLFFKISHRNAFLLAFILNIKGVLELMISARFKTFQYMDEPIYTAFVLSNVLVSAIMAPLIQIFSELQTRLKRSESTEICTRTVQATPIVSQLRVLCCIHCEDNVPGILTLLNAMNVTENGPIGSYPVHLTELIGRSMPLLEPYETKNIRLMRDSTDRIMKALSKYSKSFNFSVTIQPFRIISPYKIMHDFICKLERDESISLIILPFPESLEILGKTASLRSLIMGVEEQSPCTVGIFVDRCPPRYSCSTELPFKVAVFFFGGVDDREALALVMRMSGNPGVKITIFRIHLTGGLQEHNIEKILDDYLVKEFRAKNICNPGVEYREIEANVSVQVLDTIRSVENKYDLVVVGKRRGPKSRLDEEMNPWVDHKELGVIGDMLASSDFGGGFMSVLVMHCLGSIDRSMRISDNFQGIDQVAENRDSESLLKKFRFSVSVFSELYVRT